MPKVRLDEIELTNRTGYPAPFNADVAGRWYRRLAPATGLTEFGVSHVTLKPGAWSSQRHWHDGEDEFLVMLEGEAVLFWDLGGGLTAEHVPQVLRASQVVHAVDPQRPVGADVWDGLRSYSRQVDLVGVHRWPLLTGLELTQYRDWLDQRRRRR